MPSKFVIPKMDNSGTSLIHNVVTQTNCWQTIGVYQGYVTPLRPFFSEIFNRDNHQIQKQSFQPKESYLEFLNFFWFGDFSFSNTCLKEGGCHRDPEGFGSHPCFGTLGITVNHSKGAKKKHQQMLRINWQR